MCGICGIIHLDVGLGPVDRCLVDRMVDRLVHRGPDGKGVLFSHDRRVALGQPSHVQRLPAVLLAVGSQLAVLPETARVHPEVLRVVVLRRPAFADA
jgi:asparagine synthase (glutamine-hydrolysing)